MRLLFGFLLLSCFFACKSDSVANEVAVPKVNMKGKLLEVQEASKRATTNQALILRMGSTSAKKGATVCLPVVSQDFSNLIGFQFTMRWDSTQLEYQNVRNFGLPAYGQSNFGDRFASRGYLSTLWTEAALEGKNVPNGTTLFEVCFKNIAPAGTTANVRFADGPTTFEIIAADMGQWKLRFANGSVKSE